MLSNAYGQNANLAKKMPRRYVFYFSLKYYLILLRVYITRPDYKIARAATEQVKVDINNNHT